VNPSAMYVLNDSILYLSIVEDYQAELIIDGVEKPSKNFVFVTSHCSGEDERFVLFLANNIQSLIVRPIMNPMNWDLTCTVARSLAIAVPTVFSQRNLFALILADSIIMW
jgi:hypothetical protein